MLTNLQNPKNEINNLILKIQISKFMYHIVTCKNMQL